MKDVKILFCAGCETAQRVEGEIESCRVCGGLVFHPYVTARSLTRIPTLSLERTIAWTKQDLEFLRVTRIAPE